MVYLKDWEDFEIAAESMFMQNPDNCRFTLKYLHSKGLIQLKFTDNVKVNYTFISQLQFVHFQLHISIPSGSWRAIYIVTIFVMGRLKKMCVCVESNYHFDFCMEY